MVHEQSDPLCPVCVKPIEAKHSVTIDHGEGSWLVTTDGERYLDYSSGIGVANTGHAQPKQSCKPGKNHERQTCRSAM